MGAEPRPGRSQQNNRLPAGSSRFLTRTVRQPVATPLRVRGLGSQEDSDSSDSDRTPTPKRNSHQIPNSWAFQPAPRGAPRGAKAAAAASCCPKCGVAWVLPDSEFCRNCGQRLRSGAELASAFAGIQDALSEHQTISRSQFDESGSTISPRPPQPQVLHCIEAVSIAIQDMLQVKYGLMLDEADLIRKLRHHCAGASAQQVVTALNAQPDLHFRTRGKPRLIALRVDWRPIQGGFEEVHKQVRAMPGTARAVAVVSGSCLGKSESQKGLLQAIAVFREDYGKRNVLVGRCGGSTAPPLVAFSEIHLRNAAILEPQITSEMCCTKTSRTPEELPPPPIREEYVKAGLCLVEESRRSGIPKLRLSSDSQVSPGQNKRANARRSPRKASRSGSVPSSARLSTEASPIAEPHTELPNWHAGGGQGYGCPAILKPPSLFNLWEGPAPSPLHPSPPPLPASEPLPAAEPVTAGGGLQLPPPPGGSWCAAPYNHPRVPPCTMGLQPPALLSAPLLTPRELIPPQLAAVVGM
eukprot:TRINITY_DN29410_c0_g1_i1.p1 TRINITY_DN29410_c0_g1~~TRINITY_DN29410_c0_g1_i1.p1  ORF type:complete len:525 (-),score=76.88 TRINITY_DN29410_c0_g1_i1:8-1582(-)